MEVKQHWARIGLGWETAWELQVLLVFLKREREIFFEESNVSV